MTAQPDTRPRHAPRSAGTEQTKQGDAPFLELKFVAKAFGPRLLFRGVELRVRPGTVYLLAGANGAGKSTLMRIMAGLAMPDAGTVTCWVEPQKLGYLAHATFLYPGLTALENLVFWAKSFHLATPAEQAGQALAAVGLARHAGERAGIFSRGMAQRLNLARLLLTSPDVLLLDEPGTGLDTTSRQLLRGVVADARARGAAVVWISHDVADDGRMADRILHLEKRTLHEEMCTRAADNPASPALCSEPFLLPDAGAPC